MNIFDKNVFKSGFAKDFCPVYTWIWNSSIDRGLIEKQLCEMLEMGIRATYILPEPKEFRPTSMITEMQPEYLTDEFFELVRYAVLYADSIGISAWLYDEGGWPSGMACGHVVKALPDMCAKIYTEDKITLKQGETLDCCLCAFDSDLNRLTLPYTAEKDEEVFVYNIKTLDTMIPRLLNDKATDEFIRCTYDAYKKHMGDLFGTKLTAMFTDEPLACYRYFIEDSADFEHTTGYNIEDYLPAVFDKNVGCDSELFRIEYMDYCSRRFDRVYMQKLHAWCRENGLALTGHVDGDDRIETYAKQMGGALRHLRNMDIPGVDVILRQIFPGKKGNVFFPRIAASAANQTGKTRTLSESFAVYGDGITYDEMRYVCNYQFVRGINIINFMSVTSGRDKFLSGQCRPHFVPPVFDSAMLKKFNEYVSRMMYVCSLGKPVCNAALYMPMRDLWAGNAAAAAGYYSMGYALEKQRVYFDVADDDFLEGCRISGGALCSGFAEYRELYIPNVKYISEKAAETIGKFIAAGGRVYIMSGGMSFDGAFAYSESGISGALVGGGSENLRVMKRITDNASIYVLYNENTAKESFCVTFNEKRKGFAANAENGKMFALDSAEYSFELEGGEAVIVIFTDEELSGVKQTFPKLTPIKTVLSPKGETVSRLSVKNGVICTDDAGIPVCMKYSVEFESQSGKDIMIELDNPRYSAELVLNGATAAQLIMPPFSCRIDGAVLKKNNVLDIYVKSVGGRAFVHSDISDLSEKRIGTYHEMTLPFERETDDIGLDGIKVYEV